MVFKLVFLSLATGALYLLLGVRSDVPPPDRLFAQWYQPALFEQSIEFLAIWTALSAIYVGAIRLMTHRKGAAAHVMILVTSILFRLALFVGNGFHQAQLPTFLQGQSPLSTLLGNDRMIATLADLGSLALAPSLLRAASLPIGAALIHGWNPLVIKEVAGSGRIEALALFLLLLSIRLAQSRRLRVVSAVVYGVCLNGPLVLLTSVVAMGRTLRLLSAIAAGLALLGWTARMPDAGIVWPPSDFVGGSIMPSAVALSSLFLTRDELVPIALVFAAWLAIVLIRVTRWSGDAHELPRELLFAVGGWIFVSPQTLPWSFLVVAYLAPYVNNRGWIVFTITAPLTYLALGGEGWSFWLGFAQYFAAYATLIFFWLGGTPSK